MKLTDLSPQFIRCDLRVEDGQERTYIVRVPTIEEAQGIRFLCPLCFVTNKGPCGTHAVICWSRSAGVPEHVAPLPGRWRLVGTGYEDLTLMEEPGQSRSVLLLGGCNWHGFVTNGDAT